MLKFSQLNLADWFESLSSGRSIAHPAEFASFKMDINNNNWNEFIYSRLSRFCWL